MRRFSRETRKFFCFFRGAAHRIGLPQRFCEAKDLWEEGEGGKGKGDYSGSYSLSHDTEASFGCRDSFSRGGDRAAPLPTHLLRICAGALKRLDPCAVSKLANGQRHTSSRQGVVVCGALRLPHDLMRLPLLFPQNSLRDFCGNPENKKAFARPLHRGGYNREKSCAKAALSNFLFQMLLPDAPEGVEVSRKSFSMKNLSARNGLLHRIRDTAANLHLVLIAISAYMRKSGPAAQGNPARGIHSEGRPLTSRRTRGRCPLRKSP